MTSFWCLGSPFDLGLAFLSNWSGFRSESFLIECALKAFGMSPDDGQIGFALECVAIAAQVEAKAVAIAMQRPMMLLSPGSARPLVIGSQPAGRRAGGVIGSGKRCSMVVDGLARTTTGGQTMPSAMYVVDVSGSD